METFLDILKYMLPSTIVLIAAVYIMKSFLKSEKEKIRLSAILDTKKVSLPIRLQAYERLILFLERIDPNSLVYRVKQANMTAEQLHLALLQTVRVEFEHNLSQQLYVSAEAWEMLKTVKDGTLDIISRVARAQPKKGATSNTLANVLVQYYNENRLDLPARKAMDFIKKEAATLL